MKKAFLFLIAAGLSLGAIELQPLDISAKTVNSGQQDVSLMKLQAVNKSSEPKKLEQCTFLVSVLQNTIDDFNWQLDIGNGLCIVERSPTKDLGPIHFTLSEAEKAMAVIGPGESLTLTLKCDLPLDIDWENIGLVSDSRWLRWSPSESSSLPSYNYATAVEVREPVETSTAGHVALAITTLLIIVIATKTKSLKYSNCK